jgi:integrase
VAVAHRGCAWRALAVSEFNEQMASRPARPPHFRNSETTPSPRERRSAWLIQDDDGKLPGTCCLRWRFDEARTLAGVDFQFRDIRAKAATDTGDLAHSQKLLGHHNREMTEHYVRARIGERVQPSR